MFFKNCQNMPCEIALCATFREPQDNFVGYNTGACKRFGRFRLVESTERLVLG